MLGAGFFWSIGGLMLRSMEAATAGQLLFYRSIGLAFTLLLFLAVRHRGRIARVFHTTGWLGIVGGLCLATAFIVNVFAAYETTIANVAFLQATQVFFGAGLGWFVLREPVRTGTWVAILVAIIGVGLMVGNSLKTGTLLGNLLGLSTGLALAGFAVALRAGRAQDMLPAACLAGLFAAIASGLLATDLAVTAHDLVMSLAMGVVQLGLGFTLFTIGSRHVPAAQLMLFALSELMLAPVWVWLFIAEVPAAMTVLGGAFVIGAVIVQAFSGARLEAPQAAGR